MYNSINPINIVYRKPQNSQRRQTGVEIDAERNDRNINGYDGDNQKTPDVLEQKKKDDHQFPNGTKVAIDYSKNKINISQVITDFRSTVLAINAPKEISDEVNAYLSLVEKESFKTSPSRDIVVSNLKNASRVSDTYIAKALNKPSKVVEGWIDALFLQNVVIKADPTQVNPDFKVNLPEQVEHKETAPSVEQPKHVDTPDKPQPQAKPAATVSLPATPTPANTPQITQETLTPKAITKQKYTDLAHKEFMEVFSTAKKLSRENKPKGALVAFTKALDVAKKTENVDFKGAAHLERGKVFDRYDYVNYALNDYNEATKCNDNDIKTHAHLKMAKIYDDYVKFEPAVKHYHCAISFSGSNPAGQTRALKGLATMYAERFDKNNTETFNNLAEQVAQNVENPKIVGKTYREIAGDYGYLGENKKALGFLKKSTIAFSGLKNNEKESNTQIAQNYIEASKLMRSLGNEAKAKTLLAKAQQYNAAGLSPHSLVNQSTSA